MMKNWTAPDTFSSIPEGPAGSFAKLHLLAWLSADASETHRRRQLATITMLLSVKCVYWMPIWVTALQAYWEGEEHEVHVWIAAQTLSLLPLCHCFKPDWASLHYVSIRTETPRLPWLPIGAWLPGGTAKICRTMHRQNQKLLNSEGSMHEVPSCSKLSH